MNKRAEAAAAGPHVEASKASDVTPEKLESKPARPQEAPAKAEDPRAGA
jgi:hypothetical protein